MSQIIPRKQCYTCISNRASKQKPNQSQPQQFEEKQILLNSSKIIKGSKKKNQQHIRTQMLKRVTQILRTQNKALSTKYLSASTAQTIDNTPRNHFEIYYQQFQPNRQINYSTEQELLQYIKQRRKTSSRQSKQRLKLFNQPQNKTTLNKIIFSRKQAAKKSVRSPTCTPLQNPQITLRQTLFSKQLKPSTAGQTRQRSRKTKMNFSLQLKQKDMTRTQESWESNKFKSINLDKRMNEYMNVLLHKTRKDEIDFEIFLDQKQRQDIKAKNEQIFNYHVHNQLHNSFLSKNKCFVRNLKKSRQLIQERRNNESNNQESHNGSKFVMKQKQDLISKIKQRLVTHSNFRRLLKQ